MAMKNINIGELRTPVEFQTSQKIQNKQFSFDHVWSTSFSDWGKIDSVGLLFQIGTGAEPSTTHTLYIRYRDDVETFKDMRVHTENVNYTITKVIKDTIGRSKYFVISLMQEDDLV